MAEYNEGTITAASGVTAAPGAPAAAPARRSANQPQLWLGLMLLALHAAIAWGIADLWPRAFLLAHFGLFLAWQPVWRGERNIEARYAVLVVAVGFVFSAWSNWWLMAVWLAVLFGLIGGSVPGIADRRQRVVSMLAALYLLSLLLIWVVPHLFAGQVFETALTFLVQYGLPVLPLAITLIRVESPNTAQRIAVDLFYSVILFLLVAALVLGSFVVKQVSFSNYPIALAQTLFVIAVLLIVLSWLWSPHSGFLGLGHMLSRYLMTLGLPFERWVQRLAELAGQEAQPQRFLQLAVQHMQDLPWVSGVVWSSRLGEGEFGQRSQFSAEMSFQDLRLNIYTRWSLSPAMLLHLKLLTQMVGHFYDAKRREETQRQRAYTQAIYETGARLTHDVKNLLQSLRSLCAAVETSSEAEARALQALMQRQLPQITQRLNTTLDKLHAPQQADTSLVDAPIWWEALRQRFAHRNVRFESAGAAQEVKLPSELFDSVADNLIENALNKAADTEAYQVRVTFSAAEGGMLTVCDNGAAVPRVIAAQLFETPVSSNTGLGVGLYHAAKQAADLGYRLKLVANEPGIVCFALARGKAARRLRVDSWQWAGPRETPILQGGGDCSSRVAGGGQRLTASRPYLIVRNNSISKEHPMATAVITSKGQITIPKSVRERLGVETGDRVEFVETDHGIFTLVAATRDVKDLKGIVPKPAKPVTIEDMKRVITRMGGRR